MGQVVGEVLPYAVTIAVSPIPIIAIILMLLAPRARSTAAGFALGWVLGIAAIIVATTLIAEQATLSTSGGKPSIGVTIIKLAFGVLMLAVAIRSWKHRPAPGEAAPLPKWMRAIDRLRAPAAFAIGLALVVVNPKNGPVGIAAGISVASGSLSTAGTIGIIVVYTVVAAASVLIPTIGYLCASRKMQGPLDRLRHWLEINNATVNTVVFGLIGVVILAKGIGGLF